MIIKNIAIQISVGLFLLAGAYPAAGQFSNQQDIEDVKMSTGKSVRYMYDPKTTRLRDADSIEAALVISTGNGFASMDLKTARRGENWEVEFILPDSARAIALRFWSDGITDDNKGRGYIYPVFRQNTIVPGALAAAADLVIRGKRILSLGSAYAEQALELYHKEFLRHPEMKEGKLLDYYTALVYAKKSAVFPIVENKADSLLKNEFSEKNWSLAASLLSLAGKRAEADSLNDLIAEKTNKKNSAGAGFWRQFMAAGSADSMLVIMQQHLKDEPSESAGDRSFIVAATISEFTKEGNGDKAYSLIPLMKNSDMKAGAIHQVAKSFVDANKRLADADSLLKVAVNEPLPTFTGSGFWPPADQKRSYHKNLSEIYNTYARLRSLQGKMAEAVAFQELAVQYAGGDNTAFNETLIALLDQSGQKDELVKRATRFIGNGVGGPEMTKLLQENYTGKTAFPIYLDSLKNIANYKIRRQLEFNVIQKPLPAFSLKKMDGTVVTKESLKGKVVVLDFWATWCMPCKRSFPAMQQAQNLYKHDSTIVFLFVNTWESLPSVEREKAISKFLDSNGYNFQVLLDEPLGTGNRSYKLAADLAIEGIPTKLIIDKNGDIRFVSIGFMGDAIKMVEELSNMISIASR